MAPVSGIRYELHSIYAPRRYRYMAYAENAKVRIIAVQVCLSAFVLTKVSRSLPPHIDLMLRPLTTTSYPYFNCRKSFGAAH